MPVPGDITELQSFLGLANYYQSFIPSLHNLRALLNALLKKDSTWKWDTGTPGGIQQNQEYIDVRSVPRVVQSRIRHYSGQ